MAHLIPAVKSEFNYYKKQNLQSSVQEVYAREFSPIAPLVAGGQFEFIIEGGADGVYMDLAHSFCIFKVKITQADGQNRVANAQAVGPINNLAHSMFQRIEVYLGNKQIGDANGLYPYRAYFDTLFNFNKDAEQTWLANQLFIKDTAGQMSVRNFVAEGLNKGLLARTAYFDENREVQLIMRPDLDIFNSDTIIPPNVPMRLRFHPSPHAFVLVRPDTVQNTADVNYQLRITDAKLFIRTLVATPSQELGLKYATKGTKLNRRINFERKTLKHITVTRGQTVVDIDNIYIGEIPKRIVMVIVSDAALAGSYTTNPFNFQHYELEHLLFYVDGKPIPQKPFSPNYQTHQYLREYHALYEAFGVDFENRGLGFSRNEFATGYNIYSIDTTPDPGAKNSISLPRNGTIRIEVKFRQALQETVDLVFMSAYDSFIEFDEHNNVLFNF